MKHFFSPVRVDYNRFWSMFFKSSFIVCWCVPFSQEYYGTDDPKEVCKMIFADLQEAVKSGTW